MQPTTVYFTFKVTTVAAIEDKPPPPLFIVALEVLRLVRHDETRARLSGGRETTAEGAGFAGIPGLSVDRVVPKTAVKRNSRWFA